MASGNTAGPAGCGRACGRRPARRARNSNSRLRQSASGRGGSFFWRSRRSFTRRSRPSCREQGPTICEGASASGRRNRDRGEAARGGGEKGAFETKGGQEHDDDRRSEEESRGEGGAQGRERARRRGGAPEERRARSGGLRAGRGGRRKSREDPRHPLRRPGQRLREEVRSAGGEAPKGDLRCAGRG